MRSRDPATRPPDRAGCSWGFPGLAFIGRGRGRGAAGSFDRRPQSGPDTRPSTDSPPRHALPMNDLSRKVVRFLLDETGPTTVEYAMMLLLVFLAVLTVITALGQTTADSFRDSGNSVEQAFDASS